MKFPHLRCFNTTGLHHFEKRLGQADAETRIDLMDDAFSNPLSGSLPFAAVKFDSAKAMAENILASFGEISPFNHLDNIGLWAWLTFALRTQLFKKKPDGTLQLGEYPRWYPSKANDFQKGQRHLVRMPVFLLARLQENADHLLCNAVNTLPDIREQMAGQYDMLSPGFQRLARTLYFDEKTGSLKRGSGGKGAGSPRRLRSLRRQLGVTWQVEDLPLENVLKKLPGEFDRFLACRDHEH